MKLSSQDRKIKLSLCVLRSSVLVGVCARHKGDIKSSSCDEDNHRVNYSATRHNLARREKFIRVSLSWNNSISIANGSSIYSACHISHVDRAQQRARVIVPQQRIFGDDTVLVPGWWCVIRVASHANQQRLAAVRTGADKLAALFGDVVLERKLAKEVGELAQSVALATARGVPLRNVLLWGPPGTGKTMAAQRLARGCGMGYAMMSGGDVVPLGRDAVSELHKIFDWAEASAKVRRRQQRCPCPQCSAAVPLRLLTMPPHCTIRAQRRSAIIASVSWRAIHCDNV